MTHVNATPTRLVMRYQITINKVERPDLGRVYEGEVPMSDQQTANLKGLLGDEKSKITVSREMSELDYGNGGKVFVAVTLTCDQDEGVLQVAGQWANHLAGKYTEEYFGEMRQKVVQLGIVK